MTIVGGIANDPKEAVWGGAYVEKEGLPVNWRS
jgi:hypothetical protein